MVFSSTVFLFLFLPAVLVLYYNPIFRGRTFKNSVLLASSLLFYAWGEPVFVFLMIFSIFVTWILGFFLRTKNAGAFLSAGIIFHVAVLFVFKYLSFSASQIGILLHKDFSALKISLPVGISFFTFQLMSYLFDVYYKKADAQKNPAELALYISFFPQLIAGPVVRYEKIQPEIKNRHENFSLMISGMKKFSFGLAKKVLLSNYAAQIADNAFDFLSGNNSVAGAYLGAFCYAAQIYFDFSGYSDMAIGLGRMFGFHFDENFRHPYESRSVTEFWRRWHISLGSWFRDYVYIPMGGNRVKKSRWIFNLLFVWLLTGIWHGANWTFLAWGFFYFVLLLAEKLTDFPRRLKFFSHFYAMFAVILSWVIFRSSTISDAFLYAKNLFGVDAKGIFDPSFFECIKSSAVILIFCAAGSTSLVEKFFEKLRKTKFRFLEGVWCAAIFFVSVLCTVSSTYNPFIYFNF